MTLMTKESNGLRNYKFKKTVAAVLVNLFRYVFLIAYSYVLIYPIAFLFVRSLQSGLDSLDPTVQWIPKHFTTDNFRYALKILDYGKSLLSTAVNMLVPAVIEIFTCMIGAYGLARYSFKGKKLLMGLVILMILIPNNMTIIPNYVNLQHLDLFGILGLFNRLTGIDLRLSVLGTPFAFWLPALFGVGIRGGLFVYMYVQFFKGLPKELEEAAWIDGAGLWKTLFRVVFPTASVSVLTVTVLSLVWHWNEYFLPQLFLGENYPVTVRLGNYMQLCMSNGGQPGFDVYNAQAASCVLVIVPILIVYLILQRKFISSIALTGIVG